MNTTEPNVTSLDQDSRTLRDNELDAVCGGGSVSNTIKAISDGLRSGSRTGTGDGTVFIFISF